MIRAAAGDGGGDDDDGGGGLRDPQLSIQRIIYEQSVSRPSSYEHTLQREQFLLEPLTTKLCDLRVHDVCALLLQLLLLQWTSPTACCSTSSKPRGAGITSAAPLCRS